MKITDATALPGPRHILAEGPLRAGSAGEVLWLDIEQGLVFFADLSPHGLDISSVREFPETVGAAVLSEEGDLLVAGARELFTLNRDNSLRAGPKIIPDGDRRRLNDAAVDPAGRLLVGTLALDDPSEEEVLVRVEDDASLTIIDDDLTLSNGIAWSPDGSLLYSVDTMRGVVWGRTYDAFSGQVGPRKDFVTIDEGFPDGICADLEGGVWVAIWGAGQVRRFDAFGEHTHTVNVDAPHVSSVAFVGAEHELLLITTASRDLTPSQLQEYPLAGRLFLASPGIRGVPATPWSASWLQRF